VEGRTLSAQYVLRALRRRWRVAVGIFVLVCVGVGVFAYQRQHEKRPVRFASTATVRVAAEPQGRGAVLRISDTGRGIPSDEGDRIFSRFWQSDPKKRRGLGLGLYIAKGVIQAHGGRLWYESQEGRGSRFSFTLPKRAAEGVLEVKLPVVQDTPAPPFGTSPNTGKTSEAKSV